MCGELLELGYGGGGLGEAGEDGFDDAVAAFAHEGEGLFGVGAEALEEPVADQAVAAVEADLDVVFGEVEGVGGLGGAEFFDVAQHDDGAVVLGQAEDGLFEEISELRAGGALLGVGGFGGHLHGKFSVVFVVVQWLDAIALAETGQGFVYGDAGEPGGEGRAGGELVEVLVGADVGVLHDVFGFAVVVEDGASDAVEALVVAAHEDLVERGLSCADAVDDLFVGEAFGLGFFWSQGRYHRVARTLYRASGAGKVTNRLTGVRLLAERRVIFGRLCKFLSIGCTGVTNCRPGHSLV